MKGSEIFEPRGSEIYLEIRPVHKRLVKYKRTKRLRNFPPVGNGVYREVIMFRV